LMVPIATNEPDEETGQGPLEVHTDEGRLSPRRVAVLTITASLVVVGALAFFASPDRSSSPHLHRGDFTTNIVPPHADSTTVLDAETCSADTSGTCLFSACYPWRNADCEDGQCVCPPGKCAFQGACVSPDEVGPPPPPVCNPNTGGSCAVFKCASWRNAVCSGPSIGFSSAPTLGQCICPVGKCANDKGVCVDAPEFFAPQQLNAKTIACPVLAALYNAGFLPVDSLGRVERLQVQAGITNGLGATRAVGFGFAQNTAGYRADDPDEQDFSFTPLGNALQMLLKNATEELHPDDVRYLNIFRMTDNEDVLHQIGAGVRIGPVDPACKTWPCLDRFDSFFGRFANSDGLICAKEMGEIAGNIYEKGFHGVAASNTLFTHLIGFTGREYAALAGFLTCFGEIQPNGERCVSVDRFRHMEMKGTFPEGWVKHEWGLTDVLEIVGVWEKMKVPGLSVAFQVQGAVMNMITEAQNALKELNKLG